MKYTLGVGREARVYQHQGLFCIEFISRWIGDCESVKVKSYHRKFKDMHDDDDEEKEFIKGIEMSLGCSLFKEGQRLHRGFEFMDGKRKMWRVTYKGREIK